ncbi:hypothetical protein [Streptomyces sp. NPDC003077]|uniref:hypothetical protein n=1 Tax=Streptomyces sp. NPDC003077 TaxID=3154443 RepID=UPI0033B936D0
MTLPDHKEDQVRRLLDGPRPPVPPGMAFQAAERGRRLKARRDALRRLGLLAAIAALAALLAWAAVAHPWSPPPLRTTPSVEGW